MPTQLALPPTCSAEAHVRLASLQVPDWQQLLMKQLQLEESQRLVYDAIGVYEVNMLARGYWPAFLGSPGETPV